MTDLGDGATFPDLELVDHAGNRRRLDELVGGDPTLVHFHRGWWCPKEQAFLRTLVRLQDEAEVAYTRFVSISVDDPAVSAAFRAGLGARWTFLTGGSDLTWVSLVLLPQGRGVAFDDGAVTGALRRRLSQRWPGACSTLLVDWATFGGALTAGAEEAAVADDPFARLAPRQLLRVPAGSLGAVPAPTGPGVTRYGSGNPWPWDRYAGQVG